MEPPRERRSWSVGGTLLALGALCLVVAGFVFVGIAWGRVGIAGRTLILLAVTALAAAAAAWLTTRRLRASAEAMWVVTGFLAAFDTAAAVRAGLLGLDELSAEAVVLGFSVVLALVSLAVALWARRLLPTLVSAQVGVAVGVTAASVAAMLLLPLDLRWTLTPLAVLVVAVALVLWRGALPVAAWMSGIAGCSMLGLAALWIVVSVTIAPTFAMRWSEGSAPAALLHGALVVALAVVGGRLLRGHVSPVAVTLVHGVGAFDLAVCVGAVFLLLNDHAPVEVAAATWVAVPLLVAAVGVAVGTRFDGWATGLRAAVAPLSIPLVVAALVGAAEAWETILRSWDRGAWGDDLGLRLSTGSLPLPTGVAAGLWVGAAALVALVSRWPVPRRHGTLGRVLLATAVVVLGVGLVVLAVLLEVPVLVLSLGLLVLAAVATGTWVALARTAPSHPWSSAAGVAAVPAVLAMLASVLAPLGSAPASALTWTLGAAAAAVAALLIGVGLPKPDPTPSVRLDLGVPTAISAVLALAAALAWADVAGADARTFALVAAIATVVLAAAAHPRVPAACRLPLEVTAGIGLVVTVLAAAPVGAAWSALVLTVVGAGASALALLYADRRIGYAALGGTLLALAYVLRLVASDVGVVEAYTLPFGLVLLALGVYAVLSDRDRASAALYPGLALALLPSLPQTLADPTSLRGLLLAAASVAVLAAGVVLRWQAPFVAGTVLTVVLVLRWALPLVGEAPRWIPLAVLGVALVAVGATWEARVRDARAVVSYVRRLR